jgi:hypothetical protein
MEVYLSKFIIPAFIILFFMGIVIVSAYRLMWGWWQDEADIKHERSKK